VGYGGCFSCIYSVRGAGGYQMFGITPMPIFDPTEEIIYLEDFMVFFKPGDIVKFKPVDRAEYDQIIEEVGNNTFEPVIRTVTFNLKEFQKDNKLYNKQMEGLIHEH
ncbi:MAG: carboxyltransferase domain-containing protein, partial [Gammaproteobacteria bacterium]|nr:carboxyltransferase domain-containing protein [Gammaproteobacteria bacterium]